MIGLFFPSFCAMPSKQESRTQNQLESMAFAGGMREFWPLSDAQVNAR